MQHEIKNRYTGDVLFTADVPDGTESGLITRVALEQALSSGANLRGANLGEANLRGANLGGANLRGANLGEANLRGANLGEANLRGANLGGAYLGGAYLGGADLGGAYLGGAYLSGAYLSDLHSIWGAIGNLREIKSIQCDTWPVTYTATHMQIGCKFYPLDSWWSFSDEEIQRMDGGALEWWRKWKPLLQQIVAMSPAVPGGEKPNPRCGE